MDQFAFQVSIGPRAWFPSLSSCLVKVESLFVDDGFSSLDAVSLDIAMDALDNMHAHGRKIDYGS
jgi:exonuclease SbcC